jgi:beta-galactosidase
MARFHEWLQQRYSTLENLNRAWSNAYWSQDYSDWSQVPAWHGWQNPCLQQAGKTFLTAVYREYQAVQLEVLRARIEPRQWITHNCHAHENLDFCRIARDLDLVSWDPYLGGRRLDPVGVGPVLDFARGILGRNVWVMETQPGSVNWDKFNRALHKGEVRRLVWHCIGHGADAVLFWQWRSALGGQEQYHGCVVAPDGTPRPLYAELAQTGAELARAAPLLADTRIETQVALLDCYPDRWALRAQPHHAEYDASRHLGSFYAPLRAAGLDVDIVQPDDGLGRYRLVVAPHMHLLTADTVGNLVSFVRGGGHLLLGPRSGFKDEHNALLPSSQPGNELAALLGAHVAEYYVLTEPVPVAGYFDAGTASIWAEYLTPTAGDLDVLLRYGEANGWLDGQPALVSRPVGGGRISYLGAWLDAGLMRRVMDWALTCSGVAGRALPEGLEVSRRAGKGREVLVVVNHLPEPCTLALDGRWESVLTGQILADACPVGGGDVQVLSRCVIGP